METDHHKTRILIILQYLEGLRWKKRLNKHIRGLGKFEVEEEVEETDSFITFAKLRVI